MSVLWMIGAFFLVLTPIILVHELGHFWAARWCNIKIDEFGLGFPPRAARLFERGGTLFTLNWIPLGGFVRPAGEDDPNVPGGLAGASKRARFTVLVAGAVANFIFAILLFWVAFMIGPPSFDESRVAIRSIQADSPAMAAGLQADDIIVEVNGAAVTSTEMLVAEIHAQVGQPVQLLVDRAGRLLTITVTPRRPGEYGSGEGPTGIALMHPPAGQRASMGLVGSATAAVDTVWNVIWGTLRAPVMLIRGEISPSMARPVSVVGISQLAGHAAETTATTGDWFPILFFAGVISVALGFTNLLPLPALDGGRILFVLIEAIRGRRVEPEREGFVHMVGMLFLLGLMVLIIVQDIVNPIIPF
jgi:regulator of sigma E protease